MATYQATLNFSVNTGKVSDGMDVPYEEYRSRCRASGVGAVADYLYPMYDYEKRQLDFLVEAKNRQEAVGKILAHKDVKKVFGKKASVSLRPALSFNGVTSFDIETESENVGWWRNLSLREYTPEQKQRTIVID